MILSASSMLLWRNLRDSVNSSLKSSNLVYEYYVLLGKIHQEPIVWTDAFSQTSLRVALNLFWLLIVWFIDVPRNVGLISDFFVLR